MLVPLPGRRWDVWCLVLKMRKEGISADVYKRQFEARYEWALAFIIFSAVFDFFDGMMAVSYTHLSIKSRK